MDLIQKQIIQIKMYEDIILDIEELLEAYRTDRIDADYLISAIKETIYTRE